MPVAESSGPIGGKCPKFFQSVVLYPGPKVSEERNLRERFCVFGHLVTISEYYSLRALSSVFSAEFARIK